MYTNGAKLLHTGAQKEGTLSAVHGIRFISMTWVILGHTIVFAVTQMSTGFLEYLFYFLDVFMWVWAVEYMVFDGLFVSESCLDPKRVNPALKDFWNSY